MKKFNTAIFIFLLIFSGIFSLIQTSFAAGAPNVTAPVSSTYYTLIPITYSLPDTPLAGSVTVSFVPQPSGSAKTMTMSNSQSVSFFYNPATNPVTASPDVASANFSSLPDGNYNVVVAYQDSVPSVGSTTVTNITIDTVTQAPTLIAPVASTSYPSTALVNYSLPETPLGGSVKLMFVNTSTSDTIILTLDNATSNNFSLNINNLASASQVISITPSTLVIPYGAYNVTLAYQDAHSNPVSTAIHSNIIINTAPTTIIPSTTVIPTTTVTTTVVTTTIAQTTIAATTTAAPSKTITPTPTTTVLPTTTTVIVSSTVTDQTKTLVSSTPAATTASPAAETTQTTSSTFPTWAMISLIWVVLIVGGILVWVIVHKVRK